MSINVYRVCVPLVRISFPVTRFDFNVIFFSHKKKNTRHAYETRFIYLGYAHIPKLTR